ncbi:MAG: peroxiredoxin family protein [Alistipes sp.]|jgi:peroxiredoxin|uniref:peroxiredoxin family protein n=1 Tax=Alistipes sp. TaxID=1872444 RepID=UPI001D2454EE|nr:TlpA disulfide reductase family protein [Alistipes sp.]MBS6100682.1 TlpA family protein disulfide reductase [Alistipes sp.]HJI19697.1 TlpA family protein disulfide reductase [Rikenellaceae bacterium]
MTAKKRNGTLWILLVLAVGVALLVWLLPDGEQRREARAVADTELAEPQPEVLPDATAESDPLDEAAQAAAATLVRAGDAAPDFTVSLFDGGSVRLSDLRGKTVLVNFWATWCPPCREELTRVQAELIDRFEGRDFVFLPVSRGETRETVARFREQTGYRFPMGLDPEQTIYKMYATNFIPRNFLVGPDGRVIVATTGYEPEEFDALVETIRKSLDKQQ